MTQQTKTVDCTDCGTNVDVPRHITHDVQCEDCRTQEATERLKAAAAFDTDKTFSRHEAMERLHWEYRVTPCRLPNGDQLLDAQDKTPGHSHTLLRDIEDVDLVSDECSECGYDRVRDGYTNNTIQQFRSVRCNSCDETLYSCEI